LIETPSLSAFRALLNNARVCSTNFGGAPGEYFGNAASYFDPYDESQIKKCIEEALETPKVNIDRTDFIKFSNEVICFDYKKVYVKLANEKTTIHNKYTGPIPPEKI